MAIEHADFEGVERLAQVLGKRARIQRFLTNGDDLGGDIVSTFDSPEKVRLGKCDLIEEVIIGEDKLIKFSGWFRLRGNEEKDRFSSPCRCWSRSSVYHCFAWRYSTDSGRG